MISYYVSFLVVVHPSCIPFIRQTEETLFQAQNALKTARAELTKLESKQKMTELLAQEGAISRKQWEQFQQQIKQTKTEIADMEKIAKEATAQITTLKAMPQCSSKPIPQKRQEPL